MTLLYSDPVFLEHDTGRHPETAERLRAVDRRLQDAGLYKKTTRATFEPLTETQVCEIHDPAVAANVRQTAESGGGMLDVDTVVSPASFRVGLAAAGACVAAVDAVMTGPERTAFCLVRPPGHHATPTRSMGFCLFNNIALSARRAQKQHGIGRVLIVDFDVHHGNGTQDVFYRDPSVFVLSIHRYGNGFYPGTGAANETGSGPGLGTIRNLPIRYGTARDSFRNTFAGELARTADAFRPELVLVSAGFDAHRLDPVGSLGLEVDDYPFLTEQILGVARTHAGGRLISCLEGGYHWTVLAECVEAHLNTLIGGSANAG